MAEVQDAPRHENATDAERDFAATIAAAPERRAFTSASARYCGHYQPLRGGHRHRHGEQVCGPRACAGQRFPRVIREYYLAADKNASDCIGCGSCEPNCPFGVKIVERMEETAELFA